MRGRYKYVCAECRAETFISRQERTRARHPRCSACGSLSIDPSHASQAREVLGKADDEKDERQVWADRRNTRAPTK